MTRHRNIVPAATFALHALVFAALVWWSWRKWPDPVIDFGRELYLPWQITRGQVLYRDLASLFGPLSPYVNALWFRLFGASLLTLAICNMVIFAVTIAGIHRLLRNSTDRLTASAACLVTLLLFGFSQYVAVGNYNFASPYSHEATHGFALSVAALLSLHHAVAAGRPVFWAIAGVSFGLVLLTKPETSLAAAAGVAAICIGATVLDGRNRRALMRGMMLFLGASAVAPLLFFLYFSAHMPAADAARATAGAWTAVFTTGITDNPFYVRSMGLDEPAENGLRVLLTFAGFGIFVAAAAAVSSVRSQTMLRVSRVALLVVMIVVLRHGTFPRALPLIALTGLVAASLLFHRARSNRDDALRLLPLVGWSAFALVLLAKLGLNPRIVHYGFYLALPATTVAIVLLVWLIPRVLEPWKSVAVARSFRQIACWTLAAAAAPYLGASNWWYRTKVLPVGSGADRFLSSTAQGQWQGAAVRDALQDLDGLAASDATIAVLPEGVMLNYLLRRDSPLRVINLMPPELMAFGEDDVLLSLSSRPPDFIVLVHRDTSEYGYPLFGTDRRYGLRTMRWIEAHYRRQRLIGQDPTINGGLGIVILQRIAPPPPPAR